jgi:misacylated tRNA(Ala) deacylase
MQQHTGQHLLSAIMDKYDNLESVGWGMGAEGDINYIDLPRKPTDEEMQTIQEKCNEAIRNNLKITVDTPDDAKSDSLPEDYASSKLEILTRIRKSIPTIFHRSESKLSSCCGTHLQQTSHIGLILLHHTQSIRGTNCRMYFSAGDRAIKLASSSIRSLRSIGGVLSSGMGAEDVRSAVKKMSDNLTESRRKEGKLLMEIAKYESERVKADLKNGKKAWVYRSSGNLDYINSICFEVKDDLKDGRLVVLATGEKKTSGQVVVVGEKQTVEDFVQKMKGVVGGVKGGGKGERWQGKVIEWQKGEIDALKNLVES